MAELNKREFPRANYPCSLTLWQGNSFATIMTKTANIGAGGLLVYLNQSLMIGAKVEVRIEFSKEESLECNGIVIRCHENFKDSENSNGSYSVAIIFEGLEESKVVYLKEVVEKILTRERN